MCKIYFLCHWDTFCSTSNFGSVFGFLRSPYNMVNCIQTENTHKTIVVTPSGHIKDEIKHVEKYKYTTKISGGC